MRNSHCHPYPPGFPLETPADLKQEVLNLGSETVYYLECWEQVEATIVYLGVAMTVVGEEQGVALSSLLHRQMKARQKPGQLHLKKAPLMEAELDVMT